MDFAFVNYEDNKVSIESHRPMPAPFLIKTYQLVDDSNTDEIVSWGDDGDTFIVWRPSEFARDLLPNCFKHNNFSSFVRQLNTYGFRKIAPQRWEFANDNFRKGQSHLLCEIHRRRTAAPQASGNVLQVSSRSSPSSLGEEHTWSSRSCPTSSPRRGLASAAISMPDENDRLRRDNQILFFELARLQRLYGNAVMFLQNETKLPLQDLKQKLHYSLSGWFPVEQIGPEKGVGCMGDQLCTASKREDNSVFKAASQICFSNVRTSSEVLSRVQSRGNASHASTIAYVHGKLRELTACTKTKDETPCVPGPRLFGVPLFCRKRLHPDSNIDSDHLASDSVEFSATSKEFN
ncbi:hypothetical protein O6H91_09G110300 [Diphasiastrum complanatum]|uniref:Uncharacterized protein n=1 Tax=Diphasiastrum complanatum TaxID=34168 RepID=A0ACC2CT93_DIPCM|nr:hypothetical protein O6H91_09G110300 [Diphasiastrum complanatum]